ncbi:MAG: nucleotidyltransferase family protein, partial [Microbacter sp.]
MNTKLHTERSRLFKKRDGSTFVDKTEQLDSLQLKQNPPKVEDQLMLFCMKVSSKPDELLQMEQLIPRVTDWNYFLTIVIERGMGPICHKKLPLLSNHASVPEQVRSKLQQAYYKTFSRSVTLYDYFRKVVSAFNQAGIDVVALKGIYLSEYLYQDVGLRQFSDIDLLVKEADGEKCLRILEQLGYSPAVLSLSTFVQQHTEMVHFPPMVSHGVSIEIHTKLHKNSENYRIDLQAVW